VNRHCSCVVCVYLPSTFFYFILCINRRFLNPHIHHTNQAQATTATHPFSLSSSSSSLSLCSSHCMAANSSSRGITALGKRVANRIWTSKSPSPPSTSRYTFSSFCSFSYVSSLIAVIITLLDEDDDDFMLPV